MTSEFENFLNIIKEELQLGFKNKNLLSKIAFSRFLKGLVYHYKNLKYFIFNYLHCPYSLLIKKKSNDKEYNK